MNPEILNKLKNIRLFLFDLDGVLYKKEDFTDVTSYEKYLSEFEDACQKFQNRNLCFGIVTAHPKDDLINDLNHIKNCNILLTSVEKVTAVEELAINHKIEFLDIFYMGDDILDIPLLSKCGVSAAPKNAKREVKRVVDFTIGSQNIKELFNKLFQLIDEAN